MPAPLREVDPGLKAFATDRQAEIIDTVNKYRSARQAAESLGVDKNTIINAIRRVERDAARQGYAPAMDLVHPVPDAFHVKGVSTLYDKSGDVAAQWVKTDRRKENTEAALRDFVDWLCEDVKGKSKPIKPPAQTEDDMLAVYPMGDPHFGLYSWAEETGEDFDLDIAEERTIKAVDQLAQSTPRTKTGLFVNLGDFFHADDSKNETPGSGHRLDVDSRFHKVMRVGLRAMKHCIERLKERHEIVEVWNMPGNHDPHASYMLSLCLDNFYDNDPRVVIDLSPSLFKYKRFGKCLIGSHHGHATKMTDLPLLMAADRAEDWGETLHRVWLCGHVHHKSLKEHPGVTVETFNSLTGTDAWHAGKGYRSNKSMQSIVYHSETGELQRHTCNVQRLEVVG